MGEKRKMDRGRRMKREELIGGRKGKREEWIG